MSTCSRYMTWVLLCLAPEHKMPSKGSREGGRAVLEVRMQRTKC